MMQLRYVIFVQEFAKKWNAFLKRQINVKKELFPSVFTFFGYLVHWVFFLLPWGLKKNFWPRVLWSATQELTYVFFLNWHCVVNKRCFLKTIKINWFGHHFLVKNAFRSNYKNQCALFKNKYIYFRSNISRFKSLHMFFKCPNVLWD